MASATGNIVPTAASDCQFSTLFSDTSKDSFHGNYTNLYADFNLDLATTANNTDPAVIRNYVAAAGTQHRLLAFGVFSDGKMHCYLCPTRMERSLGAAASTLDGKMYAFDGDLFSNQGMNVTIDDALFNMQANQIRIPTITTVQDALAQDPLVNIMGPYTATDAGTEVKKFRNIIPIPNCYVNVFLANEVTPNYFFTYVYPQMVVDGHLLDCAVFIDFFRAAMTRYVANVDTSVLHKTLPVAPPRNKVLLESRRQVIMQYFPSLNSNLAQIQQSQIAVKLGQIVQQQMQFKVEEDVRRVAKEVKSLAKYLGPTRTNSLLLISRVATETGVAPVWHQWANAVPKEHLVILQSAINQAMLDEHETHLDFVVSTSHLAAVQKMSWGLTSKDAIETGLLNPFLYGDTDLVAAELANSRIELMLAGGGNPSFADAERALNNHINLPASNAAVRYIRRLKIIACAILPSQHPLTIWLRHHVRDMQSFADKFEAWSPSFAPNLAPARAIFHCKWVATKLTVWFNNQSVSPQEIALPCPRFISNAIQSEEIWEPTLSLSFRLRYKISDICAAAPPPFFPPMPHGHGSAGLGVGGPVVGNVVPLPPPVVIPRVPLQALQDADKVCINLHFASHLFLSYKERPFKSATFRKKIKSGDVPALSPSKVNQAPMCLAFHTKGQCNVTCPRAVDHVVYTDPEYVPMCG